MIRRHALLTGLALGLVLPLSAQEPVVIPLPSETHSEQGIAFTDSNTVLGEACCEEAGEPGWLMHQLQNSCLGPKLNDLGIEIGGWMQWGYHDQSNGLFNQHPNRLNLQQGWLFAERVADGSDCTLDWGFRVDLMYGVDAQDTQAFGNPRGSWDFRNGYDHGIYGWAIPQLYGEVAYDNISVKFGHFFTLVGYEVVTAPGNFFYSHAYTMNNSEPFTHTGAVATYGVNDSVEAYAGWTLGWDTGFDQFDAGMNFLGGAKFTLTEQASFTYITTLGNFGARGEGYSHSAVIDVNLTNNLEYVFQSDLVSTNTATDNDQVGVNQYLFYKINDCLSIGGRAEWWKDDGNSQFATTFGLNYRPYENVVIRPEIREDWNPAQNTDSSIFGFDVILTF